MDWRESQLIRSLVRLGHASNFRRVPPPVVAEPSPAARVENQVASNTDLVAVGDNAEMVIRQYRFDDPITGSVPPLFNSLLANPARLSILLLSRPHEGRTSRCRSPHHPAVNRAMSSTRLPMLVKNRSRSFVMVLFMPASGRTREPKALSALRLSNFATRTLTMNGSPATAILRRPCSI